MASTGYFSPPPPYRPYSPTITSTSQLPQQSDPPTSSGQYIAYSQPPTNAPVVPTYTQSPYTHPDPKPYDSVAPVTQGLPPPPQNSVNAQELPGRSNPEPVYYQPPVNAPPTPAFTPSPYGQPGADSRVSCSPATQYSPPPPPQNSSHRQQSMGTNPQPDYYQPPLNAPPTPAYTPSLSGHPGVFSPAPSAPPTQYFPPPPQSPASLSAQDTQVAYHQPLVAPPPAQVVNPSYANSAQHPQNGYPLAKQEYQPPSPPAQAQNLQNRSSLAEQQQPSQPPPAVQQTQNDYRLDDQHVQHQHPPAPPQSLPNNYYPQYQSQPPSISAQNPQNGSPSEKQEYQPQPPPAAQIFQNHYPLHQQQYQPQPPPAATPPQNGYPSEKSQYQSQPLPVPAPPQSSYPSEKDHFQPQLPPPPFSQQPTPVQSTYHQPMVYGQPAPTFSQPTYSQPFSPLAQPPQNFYLPQIVQPPTYPPIGQPQNLVDPLAMGTMAAALPSFPGPVRPGVAPLPRKDDQKSSKSKRFLGDTLVGRAARSSVSTVTSTVKLPACLSPWGDNNPVTLPNVRYRDAVLFATFHVVGGPLVDGASNLVTDAFGADTFVAEVISSGAGFINGNTIVKYGVFQIVEQAIDKGAIEHILPEVEKTIRTTSVKSLQVAIKHKLMGVDADIRFVGAYPTTSMTACDKGWFCPYLYASSRMPIVPRSQDFEIAQCFNPYLAADTALTHKLISELPCIIPLCDSNPTHHLPHARLLVLFTGISPFRANMWSTSRRPGCAQLIFHVLNGCPALVIPVCAAKTPIVGWSPWTLNQMQNFGTSGYQAANHHRQVTDCLLQLVERQGLYPCVRDVTGAFERIMGRVVTMIINGALAAPKAVQGKVFGKLDVERAGLVMFRY